MERGGAPGPPPGGLEGAPGGKGGNGGFLGPGFPGFLEKVGDENFFKFPGVKEGGGGKIFFPKRGGNPHKRGKGKFLGENPKKGEGGKFIFFFFYLN